MKHIVRKAYWNYEKEEEWLNEMSANGLALIDYSWFKYTFDETPKNEYTYRIELLKNSPKHPESLKYIEFLEESGVEVITSYMSWIYLRRKTADGEFEIYSDIESRISHYKKIVFIWTAFMWMELLIGFANIFIGIANYLEHENGTIINVFSTNVILGFMVVGMGIAFWRLSSPFKKKIKYLEQEQMIRE